MPCHIPKKPTCQEWERLENAGPLRTPLHQQPTLPRRGKLGVGLGALLCRAQQAASGGGVHSTPSCPLPCTHSTSPTVTPPCRDKAPVARWGTAAAQLGQAGVAVPGPLGLDTHSIGSQLPAQAGLGQDGNQHPLQAQFVQKGTQALARVSIPALLPGGVTQTSP